MWGKYGYLESLLFVGRSWDRLFKLCQLAGCLLHLQRQMAPSPRLPYISSSTIQGQTGDALSLGSKAMARAWPHVVLRSHCPILSPPDGFTRRWTTAPVWQGSELTGCYHCLLCTTRRPATGQGVALSVILGAPPCSVSWEKAGGWLSHSQPHSSPWVSLPSFMTCQTYLERPPHQNGPVHVFIKLKWSPRSCI